MVPACAALQELAQAHSTAEGLQAQLQQQERRAARYKGVVESMRKLSQDAQTPLPKEKQGGRRGFEVPLGDRCLPCSVACACKH